MMCKTHAIAFGLEVSDRPLAHFPNLSFNNSGSFFKFTAIITNNNSFTFEFS
ncbi:MAG: hypothetical protein KME38_29810 [Spirirestis rafaelensis WJT71-NPBG6]|nr:hypothetical protein [Spirirestis rafaelensis WJT71-NPBG6]